MLLVNVPSLARLGTFLSSQTQLVMSTDMKDCCHKGGQDNGTDAEHGGPGQFTHHHRIQNVPQ